MNKTITKASKKATLSTTHSINTEVKAIVRELELDKRSEQ